MNIQIKRQYKQYFHKKNHAINDKIPFLQFTLKF